MNVRPVTLNTTIAWLFITGSACFVVGSLPMYVDAVGAPADAATYFVGSIFFTAAAGAQLLQSQTPAMVDTDESSQHVRQALRWWAWLPHDRNWLAAISQFAGTLFFNESTFASLAHNATAREQDQNVWRPDFFGSTLFLVASTFAILAVQRLVLQIHEAIGAVADCLAEHDRIRLLQCGTSRRPAARSPRRAAPMSRSETRW